MSITCFKTQKSYSLGVKNVYDDKWAFFKSKWRKLKPHYEDEAWYDDYRYGIAATSDMLECWLGFLPGVESWDNYGDFSVTFNMDDVKEDGWSERQLIDILEDMARFVRMRRVIHAEEPWLHTTTDAYGGLINCYRHPTIDPLGGMLDIEYPHDLEPTR
jgi:hypothetical protein